MQAKRLFEFLDSAPTPFHAVEAMLKRLEAAGFEALDEGESWSLEAGKSYYVTRNGSSLIAFRYPSQERIAQGVVMVGAHTDSPALKLKPTPLLERAGVVQLGVETYGGVLLNPWFDRDLGIAGRLSWMHASGEIVESLIDFKRAVAMIPSLAIHLDPEANKSRSINPQTHLPAVIALAKAQRFEELLMQTLGEEGRVLSHELLLYDTQKSASFGLEGEFFASARLDNLLSCYIGMEALLAAPEGEANLLVCNDHEEVGSRSAHGAQSNFLESVLERMAGSRERFYRMMSASLLISSDNAHALHPNYMELHEPEHAPKIGGGVVLKYNADQSYATNSRSVARFKQAAETAGVEHQSYVVRSDMRCGSTIGPITAAKLGVETLDIGVPTWGMHSIRESAAMADSVAMYRVLSLLFSGRGA